jgi:hypothetical protein
MCDGALADPALLGLCKVVLAIGSTEQQNASVRIATNSLQCEWTTDAARTRSGSNRWLAPTVWTQHVRSVTWPSAPVRKPHFSATTLGTTSLRCSTPHRRPTVGAIGLACSTCAPCCCASSPLLLLPQRTSNTNTLLAYSVARSRRWRTQIEMCNAQGRLCAHCSVLCPCKAGR